MVLTVCLHQEESTCGGLETHSGEGKMNVAQLRPSFSGMVPKVPKVSMFLGHFVLSLNSTFSFPQCCNVGSHGSNFDVFKGAFPTHMFVSSFHSLSQCPSNNEVVVTKLCFKKKKKKKEVSTNVKSSCREAVVLDMYL